MKKLAVFLAVMVVLQAFAGISVSAYSVNTLAADGTSTLLNVWEHRKEGKTSAGAASSPIAYTGVSMAKGAYETFAVRASVTGTYEVTFVGSNKGNFNVNFTVGDYTSETVTTVAGDGYTWNDRKETVLGTVTLVAGQETDLTLNKANYSDGYFIRLSVKLVSAYENMAVSGVTADDGTQVTENGTISCNSEGLIIEFTQKVNASDVTRTNIKLYKGVDTTGGEVQVSLKPNDNKVEIELLELLDPESDYTLAVNNVADSLELSELESYVLHFSTGEIGQIGSFSKEITVEDSIESWNKGTSGVDGIVNRAIKNPEDTVALPAISLNNGDYQVFKVTIPAAGKYALSIVGGISTSYRPKVSVDMAKGTEDFSEIVASKETIKTDKIGDNYVVVPNPMGIVNLERGSYKIKVRGTYADLIFHSVCISAFNNIDVKEIKANNETVANEIKSGTDCLTVYFNQDINPSDAAENADVKLSHGINEIPVQTVFSANSLKVNAAQNLDTGETYTLSISGVKDSFGESSLNYTKDLVVSGDIYDGGTFGDTDASSVYETVTIKGKLLSSAGIGIKGREVKAYISAGADNSIVDAVTPVFTVISGEDGVFTGSYKIPSGKTTGEYTFTLKGDYTALDKTVNIVYVSEALENEILGQLLLATDENDVYAVLSDSRLGINLDSYFAGVGNRLVAYSYFIGREVKDVNELISLLKQCAGASYIYQNDNADNIKAKLTNADFCKETGLDSQKITLLEDAGLTNLITRVMTLTEQNDPTVFVADFNEILNDELYKQTGKETTTFENMNCNVTTGQGIVIPITFTTVQNDLRQMILKLSCTNAAILTNIASELEFDGTADISVNGNVATITINPDNILNRITKIGSIVLPAINTTGTVSMSLDAEIIYKVSGYDVPVINKMAATGISITVTTSSGSAESNRPTSGLSGESSSTGSSAPSDSDSKPNTSDPQENLPNTNSESKYNDMKDTPWAVEGVNALLEQGVLDMDSSGNFYPNRLVTRAEFTKMLVMILGVHDESAVSNMNDIHSDAWYSSYVASAQRIGIVTGDENGNFRGNDSLSREDMALLIFRAFKLNAETAEEFEDYAEISEYAKDAVYTLKKLGVMVGGGDNCFDPKGASSRAMAAKVLYGIQEVMNK